MSNQAEVDAADLAWYRAVELLPSLAVATLPKPRCGGIIGTGNNFYAWVGGAESGPNERMLLALPWAIRATASLSTDIKLV
jgi:hypothetical protein